MTRETAASRPRSMGPNRRSSRPRRPRTRAPSVAGVFVLRLEWLARSASQPRAAPHGPRRLCSSNFVTSLSRLSSSRCSGVAMFGCVPAALSFESRGRGGTGRRAGSRTRWAMPLEVRVLCPHRFPGRQWLTRKRDAGAPWIRRKSCGVDVAVAPSRGTPRGRSAQSSYSSRRRRSRARLAAFSLPQVRRRHGSLSRSTSSARSS